jgi:hypothetical protein
MCSTKFSLVPLFNTCSLDTNEPLFESEKNKLNKGNLYKALMVVLDSGVIFLLMIL